MSFSTPNPRGARAALGSLTLCALLLVLLAAASAQTPAPQAQTAPPATPSAVAGTWEGTFHDVPAITLKIKSEGDKLSGTVVFYRIIERGGGGPKVDGQVEVELIEPKLAGASLTFKVKPPPPPDMKVEPKAFDMELKLTGADEGVVITKRAAGAEGEDEDGGAMTQLKVTRKK